MASIDRYQTRLVPEDCAIVLVDFLDGFDPGLQTIASQRWKLNVTAFTKLAKIFAARTPVFVLGDEGDFRGSFYPQIAENVPDAPRFERHTPSAFQSEAFRSALAASGRKRVVIGGVSLDLCTLHTSLDLLKAGYEVYVVVDCSGTESELVQTAAMMRLTQAGAVMTSWVSLASELMGDWRTPEGVQVGQLYAGLSAWNGH
jgi:nicotinamidase-related amidase